MMTSPMILASAPELMIAAERAGFRAACALMRQQGDRMVRASKAMAASGTASKDDCDVLSSCGRMAHILADRTESMLSRGQTGRQPVTLAGPRPIARPAA